MRFSLHLGEARQVRGGALALAVSFPPTPLGAIRVEQDLMKLVPKERWVKTTDLIIFHGRRTCDARKPRCGECGLFDLCPWPSKQAYALGESKVKAGSKKKAKAKR